ILSSVGVNESESIHNLSNLINTSLKNLLNNVDYKKQIMETVSSNFMEKYWQKYRAVNFELGFSGISTEITDTLINEIKLLKDRINELEALKELLSRKQSKHQKISLDFSVTQEEYKQVKAS
ncbi:MAG TPA: hypothetical protein PK771_11075, partial [Spirochaetota bacterium]|nr:hypothetical protein [Spirochaetota bacterium]